MVLVFSDFNICKKGGRNDKGVRQIIFALAGGLWYNKLNYSLFLKEGQKVAIQVGCRVQMKKKHPCGSANFVVTRIGMDFKIRCEGCGREIMMPRSQCEKGIKKILRQPE